MSQERKLANRELPMVLQEQLEVEVCAEAQGRDALGNRARMLVSRAYFEDNGKEFELRVIRIVKPEGILMKDFQKIVDEQARLAAAAAAPPTAHVQTPEETINGVEEGGEVLPEAAEPGSKPISDMNYGELKIEAATRGLTFPGNVAKDKLVKMLVES